MSRSLWKGPFNQNIDKYEKKLPPKVLSNKPRAFALQSKHNFSKNLELVKEGLPLSMPSLLDLRALRSQQSKHSTQEKELQSKGLALHPKQNTRGPIGPSKKSTGFFNGQSSSAWPNFPDVLTKQSKSSNKEKKLTEKKRVWSRSSMILPHYVGRSFLIYNGKTFISIEISPKMLGHKFGEFASTRHKPVHKKKK